MTAPVTAPGSNPSPAIVPPLAASEPAPTPAAVPAVAPQPLAAATAALPSSAAAAFKPRLVTMVQPDIPQRIYDQIGRIEVNAELTVRRDGSVAGVNLLPPVPRAAVRYLVDALQRWRYDPMPTEQILRVQLVFNDSPR